ncbi:MAG: VOC family protein [Candidatus Omnitrophota bacterium]
MRSLKFGHVGISVSDVKRSVAFYKKHFGLSRKEQYAHKDIGLMIALLGKDDITLELFEFKKHKALPEYRKTLDSDLRTLGVKHFSIEVSDIEGMYKRLTKAKVKVEAEIKLFDSGLKYFFIKDPDGILIEVMEMEK